MGTEVKALTTTEFLLARLGEWEEAARVDNESECWGNPYDEGGELSLILTPPRIQSLCASMRIAIEAAWVDHSQIENEWGAGIGRTGMEAMNDVPDAVRALASIWSDHPDWREEWR